MQAPVAMCVFRGENYVVEIANAQMLEIWGKQAEQVINKPFLRGYQKQKDKGWSHCSIMYLQRVKNLLQMKDQ